MPDCMKRKPDGTYRSTLVWPTITGGWAPVSRMESTLDQGETHGSTAPGLGIHATALRQVPKSDLLYSVANMHQEIAM
jgi:hypothetical protein